MHEPTDTRLEKIDQFENVIKAYAEKLGIEFTMADSVRSDLLRLSEIEPIDKVIADATESLRLRFDALCRGIMLDPDDVVDMDIETADGDSVEPRLH